MIRSLEQVFASYRHIIILLVVLLMSRPGELMAQQIKVTSDLRQVFAVEPGGAYQGVVELTNTTDEVQQVRLYQADLLFFEDGTDAYAEPGEAARSNAAWIALPSRILSVPPHQALPVAYKITVPSHDATGIALQGTYWSSIMIEGVNAEATEPAAVPQQLTIRIEQVVRYAVHVVADVGGTAGRAQLQIGQAGIEQPDSLHRQLAFGLHNAGERRARAKAWIECYHIDGTPAGTFEAEPITLFPGQHLKHHIDISTLVPGPYNALLLIDVGDDNMIGTQFGLHL